MTAWLDPTDFVCRTTGLDKEVVTAVLEFELEYLATLGIATPPVGYVFRWYPRDPDSLPERPKFIETLVMAKECERLAGIPEATAYTVFGAEIEYLNFVQHR